MSGNDSPDVMTANNSRSSARALRKLEWHRQGGSVMAQEINVLALVKGEEKYIFLFDDTLMRRNLADARTLCS